MALRKIEFSWAAMASCLLFLLYCWHEVFIGQQGFFCVFLTVSAHSSIGHHKIKILQCILEINIQSKNLYHPWHFWWALFFAADLMDLFLFFIFLTEPEIMKPCICLIIDLKTHYIINANKLLTILE